MRRYLLASALGLLSSGVAGACSSPAAPAPTPACHLFQFRACKVPCGRGVQQCLASGIWGPCSCVVDDASYASDTDAENALDAAGEAALMPDGSPPDASRDADAATDRGLLD